MELKEFIKNVIVDIAKGMLEAKEELQNMDVLINPATKNGVVGLSNNSERLVQNIDFDLSVTNNEGSETFTEEGSEIGGKALFVSFFSFHGNLNSKEKANKNVDSSVVNRLRFSLPVSFPTNTKLESEAKKVKVKRAELL